MLMRGSVPVPGQRIFVVRFCIFVSTERGGRGVRAFDVMS